jgi:hypothetical protein
MKRICSVVVDAKRASRRFAMSLPMKLEGFHRQTRAILILLFARALA